MFNNNDPLVSYQNLLDCLRQVNFSTNPLVQKALHQAQLSHGHVTRKSGQPYLDQHIFAITVCIINYCQYQHYPLTAQLIAGALLHDVLEDDDQINEQIFCHKFGEDIYKIVKPLTKNDYRKYPGKNKYEQKMALNKDYFAGLEKASQDVAIIKMSDRLNNILTLHFITNPEKVTFYLAETKKFHLPFAKRKVPYYFKKINSALKTL